jgi:hypothetical protein
MEAPVINVEATGPNTIKGGIVDVNASGIAVIKGSQVMIN